MTIPGRATPEGTRRFQARHPSCVEGYFREAHGWLASSIGIGTYLGSPDDRTDRLVADAIAECVRRGVNVIDSAINYRYERGERSVGAALARLIGSGEAKRDELIVCTKGGFTPCPGDVEAWFRREYPNLAAEDLVAGCHCMHPDYLLDQLDRSLANLGLETVDVYYVHNPETQLSEIEADAFYLRLGKAFHALEGAVAKGKIGAYGLATWNAFRVPPDANDYVDLARAKAVAREAAGGSEDHFRFLQLPLNLAMPEAISVLEAARRLGIAAVSSGSLCQGQVIGRLPDWMKESLGLETDAQRGLQFTRSAPGLLTALVGMKEPRHIEDNLSLAAIPPLDEEKFRRFLEESR